MAISLRLTRGCRAMIFITVSFHIQTVLAINEVQNKMMVYCLEYNKDNYKQIDDTNHELKIL